MHLSNVLTCNEIEVFCSLVPFAYCILISKRIRLTLSGNRVCFCIVVILLGQENNPT